MDFFETKNENPLYLLSMEQLIYAGDKGGCGLASLKMLLVFLKKDRNYEYLEEKGAKSLEELKLLAEKEGVSLLWKKANNKKSIEENKTFPLLLLLEGKNENHLVYLKKKKGNGFVLYDPDIGETSVSLEELLEKWTGVYGEGKLQKKGECSYKKEHYLTFKGLLSILSLFLLSSLSFFLSFYFFEGEKPVYLTILFLALAGLFLILEKEAIRLEMQRFDKVYLPSLFEKKGDLTEKYKRYLDFKKSLFFRLRTFVEAPICLIGTLVVFGINTPSFLLSALFMILESTLSLLVFKPLSLKEKMDLSSEEEHLLSLEREEKSDKAFKNYLSFEKKITTLSRKSEYHRFFDLAFALLLSFLPPLIEKRIETNFFLFEFFALVAVLETYSPFLEALEKEEERKKSEAYFRANFKRKP